MEEKHVPNQDCAEQFQEILNAINNHIGQGNNATEWNKADAQFAEALNKFNFEFTLEQINEILNKVQEAEMILNSWFASKIWGKCPDGILDKEAAKKFLECCTNLKVNDFNDFLKKAKKENHEEIKKIQEEQFQEILNAINNHKGGESDTEEWRQADARLVKALSKFSFEFTLEQINEILNKVQEAEMILNSWFAFKIWGKCPDGILDKEAALIFEDFGNKSDYPKILYNNYFLSKCTSDVKEFARKRQIKEVTQQKIKEVTHQKIKEVTQQKIKEVTQQNKNRGILGGVGVTFGVLFGLGAIGLGTAVGIGALAVTIAAPIAAAIAVVGLALLGIFGYLTDRFRVNKVLNEIEEAKLNEQDVSENEIPFDLHKRKEIQNALDESNKPLLGNEGIEIKQ